MAMDAFRVIIIQQDFDEGEISSLQIILRAHGCHPRVVSHVDTPALDESMIIVCSFNGDMFEHLLQTPCRIFGAPMFTSLALENRPLPSHTRVQYSWILYGTRVLCSGLAPAHLAVVQQQIGWLGGVVDPVLTPETTHIIASAVTADVREGRSRCVVAYPEWINACWLNAGFPRWAAVDCTVSHSCSGAAAVEASAKAYRLPLLAGCRVVIGGDGISERTRHRLMSLAQQLGAACDEHVTDACTHYITNIIGGAEYIHARAMGSRIVTSKAQREWCNESEFLATPTPVSILVAPAPEPQEPAMMECDGMSAKRRRLPNGECAEAAMAESSPTPVPAPAEGSKRKRTEEHETAHTAAMSTVRIQLDAKLAVASTPISRRQLHILELVEKEGNFIDRLSAIVQTPLETEGLHKDKGSDNIFNNIGAIHDLTTDILATLQARMQDYNDATTCIADVFLSKINDLSREYTRYVSQHQISKGLLDKKMTKANFNLFVKTCELNPRCHREPLVAMLVHPVQHIARYSLLFRDILKATDPAHPDAAGTHELVDALSSLMTGVNDKTRTQARFEEMLRLSGEIEGVNPTLVHHQRFLIKQFQVRLRQPDGSKKRAGLFLFNDTLLLATKSKTTLTGTLTKRLCKPFKQIAAARLNIVDAHDVLIDRNLPQVAFCVSFPSKSEGGSQVLFLEAHSEEEKVAILRDVRNALLDSGTPLTRRMEEDATALEHDLRVTSISRNPSLLMADPRAAPPAPAHTAFTAPAAHPTAAVAPAAVLSASAVPETVDDPDMSVMSVGDASMHPSAATTPVPSAPSIPASAAPAPLPSALAHASSVVSMRTRGVSVSFASRPASMSSLHSLSSVDMSLNASMIAHTPSGSMRDLTSKENDGFAPVERRFRSETVSVTQAKVTRRRTWKDLFFNPTTNRNSKIDVDSREAQVKRAQSFQDKLLQKSESLV